MPSRTTAAPLPEFDVARFVDAIEKRLKDETDRIRSLVEKAKKKAERNVTVDGGEVDYDRFVSAVTAIANEFNASVQFHSHCFKESVGGAFHERGRATLDLGPATRAV